MRANKIILLFTVGIVLLSLALPARGRPEANIIVNNADETREVSVSVDQGLGDALVGVAVRVALQYANELRQMELAAAPTDFQALLDEVQERVAVQYANLIRKEDLMIAPSDLQTLLDQISARVIVQYANATRHADLPALPGAFRALIEQVSDRIVIQYANINRQETLTYPLELLDDAASPHITDIAVHPAGSGSVDVTWITNEFATSVVHYGAQSGAYSKTESDSRYVKQHQITLEGITPGKTYYYQLQSTDQSGNIATSAEHSFGTALHVEKWVTPQGQSVAYGDHLTYTLALSSMLETQVGVYDPLFGTTFVRFLEQPEDVIYENGTITGTLTAPSDELATVSFVVEVGIPGTAGWTVDVSNQACIYPTGGTIADDCTWSNKVTNPAFHPYKPTIAKSVQPEGQVAYGDALTYTLSISVTPGAQVTLYDPLTNTTFLRFIEQPTGISHDDGVITGTVTVTPTNQMTVSFAVQATALGAPGETVDISNRACVYPSTETADACVWSNEVHNSMTQPAQLSVIKSVSPQGQVSYGEQLLYTLEISSTSEAEVGVYDPLTGTTFVTFVDQPGNVIHQSGVITGTLTASADDRVTVSFIVQVAIPGTVGWTVDLANRACVYPVEGTVIDDCTWSNEVVNEASHPYEVYLPLILR